MDPVVGLRPIPGTDPGTALPDSDPVLVEQIAAEIARSGPMTFARFMEIALYDPGRGYYRGADPRTTTAGDFLTAPELHPIFGRTLARTVGEAWRALGRPGRFVIREDGAGSGALGAALLEGLRAADPKAFAASAYRPIELNAHRMGELRARLEAAGLADHLLAGHLLAGADAGAEPPRTGVAIANEFLDALPVHRVEQRGDRLVELFVDMADGRLVELPGPPSTPALAARLADEGIVLMDGARAEICLAIGGWVGELAASLESGLAIVIDYGRPAAELYGADRADGTLRVYARHRVGSDPFEGVGRRDLTAHVDLTAVARALEAHGFTVLGTTTQAEFLVGSGLAEHMAAERDDPATTIERQLSLRSAVGRLLDPRATGGFRVLLACRRLASDAEFSGLSYRMRPA